VTEPSGFEYCLRRIGGTSLASPTFAGVVALADQARFAAHKGAIGFLNPVLYKGGLTGSALIDVLPPSSPTAVLRNFPNATETALQTRLRTINSVPVGTSGPVIEGADTSLRTTPGYDDVTGLGTPNAPAFVSAIAAH
jgi:subtilase family serine protease